jgi:phospholipid-binding lipoprotein MlaA
MLPGCASSKNYPHSEQDPLQPMNRAIYKFNKAADQLFIRPAAVTYKTVVPDSARTVIGNIMQNIYEVTNVANDLLQGKWHQAFKDTGRFMINTTFGVFGMFDVASRMDMPRHKEDFGLTLAHWGIKKSPYLVLPILGPSTIRDGIALPVNTVMTIPYYFKPKWRNRYFAATLIQKRSELLETEDILNASAVDEYIVVRDAYLQNKNFLIDPNAKQQGSDDLLGEPPE